MKIAHIIQKLHGDAAMFMCDLLRDWPAEHHVYINSSVGHDDAAVYEHILRYARDALVVDNIDAISDAVNDCTAVLLHNVEGIRTEFNTLTVYYTHDSYDEGVPHDIRVAATTESACPDCHIIEPGIPARALNKPNRINEPPKVLIYSDGDGVPYPNDLINYVITQRSSEYALSIVCPERYLDRLQTNIQNAKCSNVAVYPVILYPDRRLLAVHDVLLYDAPGRADKLYPRTVLESLNMGLTVIAGEHVYKIPGLVNGQHLLHSTSRVDAHDKLLEVLRDANARDTLRVNGMMEAMKHDITNTVCKLTKLIRGFYNGKKSEIFNGNNRRK